MLSLIRRWLCKPVILAVEQSHVGEDIAKCSRCHSLLRVGYHLRLITHLRLDHKLPEEDAIETTTWICNRLYRQRIERAMRNNYVPKEVNEIERLTR
jgi:hypothetical protein